MSVFEPPETIKIKSDGNILTLQPRGRDKHYTYKYTKSKTKKDQLLRISEEHLIKLVKENQ